MKSLHSYASLLCVGLALCAAPEAARSATAVRTQVGTAVANCQGALPSFEGAIRKRPLSVQNEGTVDAFVSCSFPLAAAPSSASLYFNSISGSDVLISCTAVRGYITRNPSYSSKTVTAPASGEQVNIDWSSADFDSTQSVFRRTYISMSCLLPPGAGLNDSRIIYDEEIGT